MTGIGEARRWALTLALAAALALAGCGGGGDGDKRGATKTQVTEPATAAEPPTADAPPDLERLPSAVQSRDCNEQRSVLHSISGDRQPGTSKEDCRLAERFMASLRPLGDRVGKGKTEQMGTAALTELPGRPRRVLAWFLDTDGRFKLYAAFGTEKAELDTEPRPRNAFDANAKAFVDAARRKDCRALWRLFVADSGYVTSREGAGDLCADLETSWATKPQGFFGRLAAAKGDVEPVRLGATENFAFYGLQLDPRTWYTLMLTTEVGSEPDPGHADYAVYEFLPATEGAR